MTRLILWLFVIVLGLDLGAGLYEARIVVPLWADGVPATLAAWQVVASVAELSAVAMTLFYFRPTLIRLFMGHGAGLSSAAVVSIVHRWVMLSRVRIMITLFAWCAAIRALTLA